MSKTSIEWTDYTFNPWRGCTKVSPGCANCYAETMSKRNPSTLGVWGPNGNRVVAAESYWKLPLKWDREAKAAGERRRVFCASLADVFEGPQTMPPHSFGAVQGARIRLFGSMETSCEGLISATPNLDWLLLTKRPENVSRVLNQLGMPGWFSVTPNVWLGVSVENQEQADKRIPLLLQTPAAVRFLSCEPLLGPVDLSKWLTYRTDDKGEVRWCPDGPPSQSLANPLPVDWKSSISWVIVGGESGHGARPMHPDWARSIRDQCQAAGVAFFFKQVGEWGWGSCRGKQSMCMYGDGRYVEFSKESLIEEEGRSGKRHDNRTATVISRMGKKLAGRLLDGRLHDEFPSVLKDQP